MSRTRVAAPGQTPRRGGGRAVVIGASIAGLTAARALIEHFDEVVIVERDRLPDGPTPRRGVPQGRHIHLLLAAGARALEDLCPGIIEDMTAAGAPSTGVDRARLCFNGHRLAKPSAGERGIGATRPFLEWHVLERVGSEPELEVHDEVAVTDLVLDDDGARVAGVRVQDTGRADDERTMPCDAVVDASGRRSPTPRWLEEHGYEPPPVDEVPVDVHYATHLVEQADQALAGDHIVAVGPRGEVPLGGVVLRVEDDRAIVTLYGLCGERPPRDLAGLESFATRLPIEDVAEVVREGDPVTDPASFRFPANRRHRYERLRSLPFGLLVTGDAVSSFNPIYGQGMTVAALEAVTLRNLLAEGGVPSPVRWFGSITPVVDRAWDVAIGADLALPCVPGRRNWSTRCQNAYVEKLHAAARHDPTLTDRFFRVSGLSEPASRLLRPGTLARVLRGSMRR